VNYDQLQFWLLFASLLLVYRWLSHRGQNRVLLAASYAFYGFWDYRFLFLILISTVIDFVGGLGVAGIRPERGRLAGLAGLLVSAALLLTSGIDYPALWQAVLSGEGIADALPHRLGDYTITLVLLGLCLAYGPVLERLYRLPEARRRKAFLIISMVANLGILGFFKYCDFFIHSANELLVSLGVTDGPAPLLGIILPAGISFYTFQAMSYTIDIYRREVEPTESFADFALFVCFFPHLVAGPIMRAHELLPQVLNTRPRKPGNFEAGLQLIVIGLFKKMVVADNMAPIANGVFIRLASGDTQDLTGAEVLVGIYAFAVQIYGDFSGYSSIARGISKWLGFELVINFRQPYLAVSPSDFWRRWHISLSTWLRDYLYIPLGGNRGGVRREYRNLMLTMLLGGLWHGASWTFVAWGTYHGLILCGFRLAGVRDVKPGDGLLRWLVRVAMMFHITCLGWLLFRADTFGAVGRALTLVVTDFRPTLAAFTPFVLILFYALPLVVLELWTRGEERLQHLTRAPILVQSAIYSYLLYMIFVFQAGRTYEFIYFQF
jgi:D-alanyl-lipoteichoic acid acyltransferase DltB (MBOAT superfamily)